MTVQYWARCTQCRHPDDGRVFKLGFFTGAERDAWVVQHTAGSHIVEKWDETPTFPVAVSLN